MTVSRLYVLLLFAAVSAVSRADQPNILFLFADDLGRPAEELYDLKKDPHQMHNLAANPEYAKTRDELRKKLMGELRENNDPRLDGDAFDKPPYLVRPPRS